MLNYFKKFFNKYVKNSKGPKTDPCVTLKNFKRWRNVSTMLTEDCRLVG